MSNVVISAEELRLLVKAVVAETILEISQAVPTSPREPETKKAAQVDWLTREEAAAYLGVTPTTLSNWASNGTKHLPYYSFGRRVKYRKKDLDEWVETQRIWHA